MKLTITKSKNSEHFYVSQSFINSKGKSTTKTYKKLGSLNELMDKLNLDRDGVIAWAKKQAKIETDNYKKENETVMVPFSPSKLVKKDHQRVFNCSYLFLQSICASLRFDNIVRNINNRHNYEYDLEAILTDLIYSRILEPSSKKSSYSFCKTLLEKPKYELHDIYRALKVLSKESDYIQAEMYRNSNFIHKRNNSVLYYDCTNYYFEIEQEDDFRKYGKSKENRPNPIVGMGLFMDGDGFPLAFGLHPGNQNEQTTLKPLEQKVIRDFDLSEFIYCSDSGLASSDNKLFNTIGNRAYVITQSLKKLKEDERKVALDPRGFKKVGSNKQIDVSKLDENDEEVINTVYYKEMPHTAGKVEETIIITYSVKYKNYQRKVREGQIARANKMISSKGKIKKTKKNPNDPARFIKKMAVNENGEVVEEVASIDNEAIDKEKMFDGYYAVATNIDDDIEQIININKRRWQIEECFKIMKTEFKARPTYVSTNEAIQAHFLICFLALLVYRILEYKLNNKYTVEQLVDTLRDMKVTEVEGTGYIPSYTRTDITDNLHELFGYRTDYEITKKSKMRSIIKQSKDKNILL